MLIHFREVEAAVELKTLCRARLGGSLALPDIFMFAAASPRLVDRPAVC